MTPRGRARSDLDRDRSRRAARGTRPPPARHRVGRARAVPRPALGRRARAARARRSLRGGPGRRRAAWADRPPPRRLRPDLVHFHAAWAASKCLTTTSGWAAASSSACATTAATWRCPTPELRWRHGHRDLPQRRDPRPRRRARLGHRSRRGHRPAPAASPGTRSRAGARRRAAPAQLRPARLGARPRARRPCGLALARDRGVACGYRIIGTGDDLQAVAFARHQLGLSRHVEVVAPGEAGRLADELGDADASCDPAVDDRAAASAALDAAQEMGVPHLQPHDGRPATPRRCRGAATPRDRRRGRPARGRPGLREPDGCGRTPPRRAIAARRASRPARAPLPARSVQPADATVTSAAT